MSLVDQPRRMNSTASQSSNSGWLGASPWMPKSSAVRTRPASEELLPEPVHGDARGEGVLLADDPAGEGEAVARGELGQRGQHFGHIRLHGVLRAQELAAVVDARHPRRFALFQREGGGVLWHFLLKCPDFGVRLRKQRGVLEEVLAEPRTGSGIRRARQEQFLDGPRDPRGLGRGAARAGEPESANRMLVDVPLLQGDVEQGPAGESRNTRM